MIPREPSPEVTAHMGDKKFDLTHDNTIINTYSEEYGDMNNVLHQYKELGATAVTSVLFFNQTEMLEALMQLDFPYTWRKYPSDMIVEKYTEYQMRKLEIDLNSEDES